MNRSAIEEEIRRLGPWHHDIEVAPGIRTGDPRLAAPHDLALGKPTLVDPERDMRMLIGDIFPDGLGGRSFLDCACNAGGHSFAARRLGAGKAFGFDVRQRWIDQARFVADQLGLNDIAFAAHKLTELPPLAPFDVTLFRGIFYHLPDPVAGLKAAADLTRELIVVNTASRPGPGKALVLNLEGTSQLMSGVDRIAWLPTGPGLVADLLAEFGFRESRVRFDWRTGPERGRFEVLAARDAATFAHFDRIEPDIRKHAPAPRGAAVRPGLLKRLLGRLTT